MTETFGTFGESLAMDFLQSLGYEILARGYHARYGEIDLIAKDGACLVFVEVKTRKSAYFAEAREAVSPSKRRKLRQTAEMYLMASDTDLPARFDVIEVYAPQGIRTEKPEIIHLEDAFQ